MKTLKRTVTIVSICILAIVIIVAIILGIYKLFPPTSTIVGAVYEDHGILGSLDYSDTPLKGLLVNVYKLTDNEKGGSGSAFVKQVQTNERGEYSVSLPKGEYTIAPVLATEGYPGWGGATYLISRVIVIENNKQTQIGPLFLIQLQGGKG